MLIKSGLFSLSSLDRLIIWGQAYKIHFIPEMTNDKAQMSNQAQNPNDKTH